MSDPNKTLVILIDVMNLAFRTHFAFRNLSSEGRSTGVLFGALKAIHTLQEKVSRRLLFCWDHGVPVAGADKPRNWRDGLLPSYKATRKHDDGEWKIVVGQLPTLYQLLQWLGYSSVSVLGLEADDIISLLAANTRDEYLIFSTDKDLYQIVTKDDRVRILVPKREKSDFKIITASDIEKEYGIPVDRWAEFLALGGDSCDNIKPMRGMGPKTAIKLIQSGVDLRNNSPYALNRLLGKYSDAAEDIRRSYEVARLPTQWDDPRIKSCVLNSFSGPSFPKITMNMSACNPDQHWPSEKHRQEAVAKFTIFLSDNEMSTLLAVRRQFFNQPKQGEQTTCQPNRIPNPRRQNPVVRRSLL